ncbi:hypothetical protein BRADI_3g52055v3 [Brachypodium distachyon]|uniref:Uncharacterized protein n=1 Tax=Brachypodium distachyon TaxID=15368 RepID=A0A0Q3FMT2_BRADI|nr:hypothetical protein BRADI_3g52055v3 [Brachypodium distachyon]
MFPKRGLMYHGSPLLLPVLDPLTSKRLGAHDAHMYWRFVAAMIIQSTGLTPNGTQQTPEVSRPHKISKQIRSNAFCCLWRRYGHTFFTLSCHSHSTGTVISISPILSNMPTSLLGLTSYKVILGCNRLAFICHQTPIDLCCDSAGLTVLSLQ